MPRDHANESASTTKTSKAVKDEGSKANKQILVDAGVRAALAEDPALSALATSATIHGGSIEGSTVQILLKNGAEIVVLGLKIHADMVKSRRVLLDGLATAEVSLTDMFGDPWGGKTFAQADLRAFLVQLAGLQGGSATTFTYCRGGEATVGDALRAAAGEHVE
jgi:hypothetical protein